MPTEKFWCVEGIDPETRKKCWLTWNDDWTKLPTWAAKFWSVEQARRACIQATRHAKERKPVICGRETRFEIDPKERKKKRLTISAGDLTGRADADEEPTIQGEMLEGVNLDQAAAVMLRQRLDILLAGSRSWPEAHTLSAAQLHRMHETCVYQAALFRHAIAVLEDRAEKDGDPVPSLHPVTLEPLTSDSVRFLCMNPNEVGRGWGVIWYRHPKLPHSENLVAITPDGKLTFTDATEIPTTREATAKAVGLEPNELEKHR